MTKKSLSTGLAGMLAVLMTTGATAQTSGVVVMRKTIHVRASSPGPVITPTTPTPAPPPAPTPVPADWIVGDWVDQGPTACTTTAPQMRTVECRAGGLPVETSKCSGTAPEASRTSPRYDGCTHSWSMGEWSAYSSTCADSASRTRRISCQRSDGQSSDDTSCDADEKPIATETAAIHTGCGYVSTETAWGSCGYNDGRPNRFTHSREVTCTRSDGTAVATSFCGRETVEREECSGNGTPYEAYATRGMKVPGTLDIVQVVLARDGITSLTYQGDGHLCIYRNYSSGVWCNGVHGYEPGRMTFRDGVAHTLAADGRIMWTVGEAGNPGSSLVLLDTGQLQIIAADGRLIWTNF